MERFPIIIDLKYSEPYLPTKRHRIPRYRDAVKKVRLNVRALAETEAPVAFILSDYQHREDAKTIIRYYKGQFFQKMNLWDVRCSNNKEEDVTHPAGVEYCDRLIRRCLYYRTPEEKELPEYTKRLRNEAHKYIIINGCLWEETGEPRYMINTFGLGHNHGGTGLFVENCYNGNIPNKNYFSALDGDKAVEQANAVASRRGDTKDVGRFKKMIEVLMPETVKVKPMRQHGKGDPFMNTLNSISESSGSAIEAGLLNIMATSAEINKRKK